MATHTKRSEIPSHTPGTHRGEQWVQSQKEPGRERATATARNSTGVNAHKRGPIDPRMPQMPPA